MTGVARSGMSNPPQNEDVAKALLKDLNTWKVQHKVEPRNQTPERRRKALLADMGGGMTAADLAEALTQDTSSTQFGSHSGQGFSKGGARASSYGGVRRGRKQAAEESPWQLGGADGKPKGPSLGDLHAPEGDFKWRFFQLRNQARDHGFMIDKMDAAELGTLMLDHNSLARNFAERHASVHPNPVLPSRQLSDLSCELGATCTEEFFGLTKKPETPPPSESSEEEPGSPGGFFSMKKLKKLNKPKQAEPPSPQAAASQEADGGAPPISPGSSEMTTLRPSSLLSSSGDLALTSMTSGNLFSSPKRGAKKMTQTQLFRKLSQEAPSSERLLEMAQTVMHAGPNELQLRLKMAKISVLTAGKLADPADPGEEKEDEEDPLFSNRNRNRLGKPLPVPYWGRNGSAPVLRASRHVVV